MGAFAFDGFAESVAEAADAGLVSVGTAAFLVEVLSVKWVRGNVLIVIGSDVGSIPGIVDRFAVGFLCDS